MTEASPTDQNAVAIAIDTTDHPDTGQHPPLEDVDGFEAAFRTWAIQRRAPNTVTTYWNQIKDAPYVHLHEQSPYDISGALNKYLNGSGYSDKGNVKTALTAYLRFLFRIHRDDVDGRDYERLRMKRNSIESNLEVEDEYRQAPDRQQEVKNNYIHPDDLISLLRRADEQRARFWYLLYCGGFRIGELKRATPAQIKEDRGPHGTLHIPSDKTKSTGRDVEFLSDTPLQELRRAPVGDWTDKNGRTWEGVFFPEFDSSTEYYHMKQKLCSAVGIGGRTVHSLRHTRITHLVNDASQIWRDDVKEFVQKQAGHSSADTTDIYIETSFDRDPKTLETYCEENGVDIAAVIRD